ncbi:HEAT repeat domain-containing protein [PVC group bacterium]|nr:HEAT repeat domain-containing protein [PVC group bacterium]
MKNLNHWLLSIKERRFRSIRICLGVIVIVGVFLSYEFLTARSRVESEIKDIYFSLKQASAEKQDLDSTKREELISKLISKEPSYRWEAASELARWKDQKSVNAIIDAMRDTKGTIRTCVMAESLGRIGDRKAIPALIQAMNQPVNQDLRICATQAIGEMRDNRALSPLIEKIRHSEDEFFTAEALGKLGDKKALPILDEAAKKSKDPLIQAAIHRAIVMIQIQNKKDLVSAFIEALNNEDDQIRFWALKNLALKRDSKAIEPIANTLQTSNSKDIKIYAAATLAYYGKGTRPFLEKAKLTDDKITLWAAEYAIKLLNKKS